VYKPNLFLAGFHLDPIRELTVLPQTSSWVKEKGWKIGSREKGIER